MDTGGDRDRDANPELARSQDVADTSSDSSALPGLEVGIPSELRIDTSSVSSSPVSSSPVSASPIVATSSGGGTSSQRPPASST
jgi:hypothetical protein